MTTTPDRTPNVPGQPNPFLATNPKMTDEDIDQFRARWEQHKNDPPTFLPRDGSPASARMSPPWNGFDTFLRRGVMIAAFVILWMTIAVGVALVIGGAAVISNLSDNGGSSSTVDPTIYGPVPTVDPNGECIGEVPC